jgi:hypothetical protein
VKRSWRNYINACCRYLAVNLSWCSDAVAIIFINSFEFHSVQRDWLTDCLILTALKTAGRL